jgi:hypothetical protein
VVSIGAFVFASITIWYMFADKFHRWEERTRRRTKDDINYFKLFAFGIGYNTGFA